MFVLGIDPGLSRCGYAVVEACPSGPRARRPRRPDHTTGRTPLPARLAELQRELRALLDEFRPAAVAVERVLFQVNVRTAMSVGQASGLAMAEAAAAGCEVVAVLAQPGEGGRRRLTAAADKAQVQQMVQTLLGLARAARAARRRRRRALALCHLAHRAAAVRAAAPGRPTPSGRPAVRAR